MADRVIDLLDGDFYVNDPYPTYAWMRTHAPAYWDGINELWGITRYDDVVRIEKDKQRFISSDQEKGGYRPNLPADAALIGLDDPVHTKRRNLVSRRFTPRAAAQWEDDVRAVVNALLDDMVAQGGECEIVETLAAPLPAMMIGKLLGFEPDRWRDLKRWSETTIALGGGPRYVTEEGLISAFEFAAASAELFEAKRGCPADDVMTVWTQAEVDGVPLTLDQVIPDCLLLLDGGAETTRTVIGRTILNFIANPDQWAAFRAGADAAVATEESRRTTWSSRARPSGRVSRWCSCIPQRTGTPTTSTIPRRSSSPATPIPTWPSGSARTSAWAPRWPGSRSGCSSRSCADG
jgi:cytochrome P450 family 142 subfamily A polypeptide 1